MLIVPITTVETLFFFGLFVIWVALLSGGFTFGILNTTQTQQMPRWTQLGASATLSLAAWFWAVVTLGTQATELALFMALGITFSLIGDIFITGSHSLRSSPLLAGIGAYTFGNVAYIIAMLQINPLFSINDLTLHSILIAIIISICGWYTLLYRRISKPSKILYAALPYAIILTLTTITALRLALYTPAFLLVALGTLSFFVGHLLLGLRLLTRFVFRYIDDFIWLVYNLGQMLIIFGIIIYTLLADPTITASIPS